jgi:putative tryptophan/tyrosine transport system substrate-binding protein
MQFNLSILIKLIAPFIIIFVWATPTYAEKTTRILVVANSTDVPYQQTITGFKGQISSQTKPEYIQLALAEVNTNKLADIKPDLIFALGAEATQWAKHQTASIPIVATLVLKDDILKQSANITGVSLIYSLKTQFQWLKKFFPGQKNVAVLFNPSENATTVQTAITISQQEGFKLNPIPVETPKELPYALERLTSNVDILMAIPDETVMSVNTAKEVLLASFSNKVPFVGLSDNWVKSGALYALSWDYEDLGKQCASMAQKILGGSKIQSISPEQPRKVAYTINIKIAEHMNIEIPANLLKNAKMIFN